MKVQNNSSSVQNLQDLGKMIYCPMNTLKDIRKPKTLVENKISFAADESEVSIYDTYEKASRVRLQAGELLLCGMLSGKKIMHSEGVKNRVEEQVFLPHESFIMAPGERVEIDFPDATMSSPTTCLTVEIAKEKVLKIHERMYENLPALSGDAIWQPGASFPILHTHHSQETQQLLNQLTHLFTENHPDRKLLIDLHISELIVRMLRHTTREFLLRYCNRDPEANSLVAALYWINKNLPKPLDIDALSKHACMSRSSLYELFRKQLGCSPLEWQQQTRLTLAAERIKNGESITVVSYDLGFNTPSHFCHRFKNLFGCTASEYKLKF